MTKRSRAAIDAVIKAYDVRGVVGDGIDEDLMRDAGAAFGLLMRREGAGRIAIGHDMRDSSPGLSRAFAEGAAAQGVDVVMLGLTSTDQLYYASGTLNCPGAMFTASHNPAEYNGIKLCRAGARPVGQETGLGEIKDLLVDGVPEFDGEAGEITERDVLSGYAEFLRGLVRDYVDILFANEDEARAFTGEEEPLNALNTISEPCSCVVPTAVMG